MDMFDPRDALSLAGAVVVIIGSFQPDDFAPETRDKAFVEHVGAMLDSPVFGTVVDFIPGTDREHMMTHAAWKMIADQLKVLDSPYYGAVQNIVNMMDELCRL